MNVAAVRAQIDVKLHARTMAFSHQRAGQSN
jgi:hypothetical protein